MYNTVISLKLLYFTLCYHAYACESYASIENAKHKMSRCVLWFFSFYLYYLTNNSIINIDLDSSIWSHWQFLNTNIRTFLNSPTSLSLHSTVQWERGPFFVVDRGWCLEIAASVKRQFEVRRLVLVGGTLPSTICEIVIQEKEPCKSDKTVSI